MMNEEKQREERAAERGEGERSDQYSEGVRRCG